MIRRSLLALAGLLVLAVAGARSSAAEPAAVMVDHKTLYLADPLGEIRRVEIRGTIMGKSGSGTILLDANQCKLNEFGDRKESQLALIEPIPITFQLLESEPVDPSPSKSRQVFAIVRSEGMPALPNLVLMVARDGPSRLIHLVRDGTRRAITLEPRTAYDGLAK